MRTEITRINYENYNDVKKKASFKGALIAFISVCALFLIVITLSSRFAVNYEQDQGTSSTIDYIINMVACSVLVYASCAISALLGFSFTYGTWSYPFKKLPLLIKNNKKRLFTGLLKSLAWSLGLTAFYWIAIQKVPIAIPYLGIWIWSAIISTRFAINDAYRIHRDDHTIIDSFLFLAPKKLRKRDMDKEKKLTQAPFLSFGDGILAFPIVQAFLIALVTSGTMVLLPVENLTVQGVWGWAYTGTTVFVVFLWSFLYRLFDGFKPFGERGKLSIVRDADGSRVAI